MCSSLDIVTSSVAYVVTVVCAVTHSEKKIVGKVNKKKKLSHEYNCKLFYFTLSKKNAST